MPASGSSQGSPSTMALSCNSSKQASQPSVPTCLPTRPQRVGPGTPQFHPESKWSLCFPCFARITQGPLGTLRFGGPKGVPTCWISPLAARPIKKSKISYMSPLTIWLTVKVYGISTEGIVTIGAAAGY